MFMIVIRVLISMIWIDLFSVLAVRNPKENIVNSTKTNN